MGKYKTNNYWEPIAKILEVMPRFQEAVAKIRADFNIPAKGIPYEERASWYQKFFINPDVDTASRYGWSYEYQLLPPNKKLLDAIDNLRHEFNLDARWMHPLFAYISDGSKKLGCPSNQSASVTPRFNDVRLPKDKLRVTSLSIRIEKDTSFSDIRAIWAEIEKYQKYMDSVIPTRRDAIQTKTVEKYRKIIELRNQGLKYQEIADQNPDLGFIAAEDIRAFVHKQESRFKKSSSLRNVPDLWWHNTT